MGKQWQVSGECAYATVDTTAGRAKMLLYKGSVLPPGVPEKEIEHLKASKLIVPFGDEPLPGAAVPEVGVTGSPQPDGGDSEPGDSGSGDDGLQARLDAARSELPEDGSAPKGNAKSDVLAAFLASKGYDFGELVRQDRADLVALAKQNS